MASIQVNGMNIEIGDDGHLVNWKDWTEDVAKALAEKEGFVLNDRHWEIIRFLRKYYEEYEVSPTDRVLIKAVGLTLGKEKGNPLYMNGLFPNGPGKMATKFAGLSKP